MKYLLLTISILFLFSCKNAEETKPPVEIVQDTVQTKPIEPLKLEPKPEPKPELKSFVPDYDTMEWVELISLDSSIILDLRYATSDNFVEEQLYDCGRCFLRHEVANQLLKVHRSLQEKGFSLKMLDCYRPLPIQQRLWDKFQNASYVTPPSKGSMHNRGLAVDLTIVDADGNELDMGTAFDFFGKEAHHTFTNFSDTILANRALLRSTMEASGFKSIRTEWWHYSYPVKMYKLSEMVWNCETEE